jgi:hypothetical protein
VTSYIDGNDIAGDIYMYRKHGYKEPKKLGENRDNIWIIQTTTTPRDCKA